jgi:dipeptidyl aminopeptidase/acylaminoacyl peptidase
MLSGKMKVIWLSTVILAFPGGVGLTILSAQEAKKTFTVADEIGLTHFGDPYTGQAEAVQFSPDGNYFAVYSQRGRLDKNLVEGSIRFYRTQDADSFLEHSNQLQPPSPIWVVTRSYREGGLRSIISNWRWVADSSGVVFLEHGDNGYHQLSFADLQKKTVEQLTSRLEAVSRFDVRDRNHYVYTVADPVEQEKRQAEDQAPAVVGTGRDLMDLLLPGDPHLVEFRLLFPSRSSLWEVVGGKRFEVKHNGASLVLKGSLALSPDGNVVVTTLPVSEIPTSWETLYPPPYPSDPERLQLSHSARQYVRIDVQTSSVQSLTGAPISSSGGYWADVLGGPSWSNDGQKILLPGTFLNSADHAPSRPCVAVVDLLSKMSTCVEMLKGHTETGVEEGYHMIKEARFVDGDKQRIMVSYYDHKDNSVRTTEYHETVGGAWRIAREINGEYQVSDTALKVSVKQRFNEPPLLVATNKQTSRIIWDPNPQLKSLELGEAVVRRFKDKEGREWKGGIYKPSNYVAGQRYPLVIQTHGFPESEFRPSGVFPTAFAARALAAAGIVVLQLGERDCLDVTPDEGPCTASGYEFAASQLVAEGLVDPEKIGIVGFSRTCFYVMETLTTGSLHLKAASITDGFMVDYLQYLLWDNSTESDPMIGAKPFGEGLQQWLKRSPGFNLDKVNAPLLVVGRGPWGVLGMWQPYIGLRYLHKPVDLVMLNTDEHVLSNPAVRMASQGGSVDWFRFWLQEYEDPDPAKADQYKRWRELRKMQAENESRLTTPRVASQ